MAINCHYAFLVFKFCTVLFSQLKLLFFNFLLSVVKFITNRRAWVLVPTKLVEPGKCLAWGGGFHGNPASSPHPAPSHWTIQWNTYRPMLTWPIPQEGGRDGKKPKHKMACKQQAIATTLCEELQASNCVYKSRGAPARRIGPPLV